MVQLLIELFKFGFITSPPFRLKRVSSIFLGKYFIFFSMLPTEIKDFFVGEVVDCTSVVLNLRYFVPV
ncbi:hypothetical protein NIES4073_39950 [Kalymmatonema gypsitolerans NIES-4073]|nr:hypothetical protein NIES4073_39950 [Scytonema sp. NIES-4073]